VRIMKSPVNLLVEAPYLNQPEATKHNARWR